MTAAASPAAMSAADDAYAVLGVAPSASDVEIRAAYLRLARIVRKDD